jgi:hypothetical protein
MLAHFASPASCHLNCQPGPLLGSIHVHGSAAIGVPPSRRRGGQFTSPGSTSPLDRPWQWHRCHRRALVRRTSHRTRMGHRNPCRKLVDRLVPSRRRSRDGLHVPLHRWSISGGKQPHHR